MSILYWLLTSAIIVAGIGAAIIWLPKYLGVSRIKFALWVFGATAVTTVVAAAVIWPPALLRWAVKICEAVFIIGLASPLYSWALRNDPKRPTMPHAFTGCRPNQLKLIMRNETLIRVVMNSTELTLKGRHARSVMIPGPDGRKVRSTLGRHVYEIIEGSSTVWDRAGVISYPVRIGESEEKSVVFDLAWSFPLNWFKVWSYITTGDIFTGFPKYQHVYWMELPRVETKKNKETGQLIITTKDDVTDHVIIHVDSWPIRIDAVETADLVSVTVLLTLQIRIVNPFLALFKIAKWYEILESTTLDHLITIIGVYTLEGIIGEVDYGDSAEEFTNLFRPLRVLHDKQQVYKEISDGLRKVIDQIPETALIRTMRKVAEGKGEEVTEEDKLESGSLRKEYGIEIVSVQINDIVPPKNIQELMARPTSARLQGRATILEGVAEAKYLELVRETINKPGGREAQQYRALVEAAKAAGTNKGNLTLLAAGGAIPPDMAAILQKLDALRPALEEPNSSSEQGLSDGEMP